MTEKNYGLSAEGLEDIYNSARERVLGSDSTLDALREQELLELLGGIEAKITEYERLRLQLGRMIDYNLLKKRGFSADQLRKFDSEVLFASRL